MRLVEHIFLIRHHPEHLSSPLVLCRVRVLYITVCPFVSFPLAMMLSFFLDVPLMFTSLISSNLLCTLAKLSYARFLFFKVSTNDLYFPTIYTLIILYAHFLHYPFISLDKRHFLILTSLSLAPPIPSNM